MKKLTIDDLQLRGKRILVRVDFNVPLDDKGHITDDTRIVETLPTIKKILSDGGRAILMSHLGRPKGRRRIEFSLEPVARHLSILLNQKVKLAPDCIGSEVEGAVNQLKDGECLLLENLRFHAEEEENDTEFSKQLARLGDVYINDAFGSAHRAHASTEGITKFIRQCAAGYLIMKELDYLGRALQNPTRPYVAVLGGAKISGKIDVIENLLDKVDVLLIGGGMAFTFFKAQGMEIGDSLVEADKIDTAQSILNSAFRKGLRFLLPVDCVVGQAIDESTPTQIVDVKEIKRGWRGLDIGPRTVELFKAEILNAKTVVWNGPMGVFEVEKFAAGTKAVAEALAEATQRGCVTIDGGGDSPLGFFSGGFANFPFGEDNNFAKFACLNRSR